MKKMKGIWFVMAVIMSVLASCGGSNNDENYPDHACPLHLGEDDRQFLGSAHTEEP